MHEGQVGTRRLEQYFRDFDSSRPYSQVTCGITSARVWFAPDVWPTPCLFPWRREPKTGLLTKGEVVSRPVLFFRPSSCGGTLGRIDSTCWGLRCGPLLTTRLRPV